MAGSSTDKVMKLWEDLKAELETIAKYASSIIEDFVGFFKDGNFDIKTLVAKILGDTVDVVMDSLVNLSDLLLTAAHLGVSVIRELCNSAVEVPVFTWLWKLVTKGRPLSLGSFISFIVAIPLNLLHKVAKGRAAPKLKGRITGATFQEYVEQGSVSKDANLAGDIASFSLCAAASTIQILGTVSVITFAIDEVLGQSLSSTSVQIFSQKSGGLLAVMPSLRLRASPTSMGALKGTGKGDWIGNFVDGASLVLESLALAYEWPLRKHLSRYSLDIQMCYWGVSLSTSLSPVPCTNERLTMKPNPRRGFWTLPES